MKISSSIHFPANDVILFLIWLIFFGIAMLKICHAFFTTSFCFHLPQGIFTCRLSSPLHGIQYLMVLLKVTVIITNDIKKDYIRFE
jgi:hypothetical protein